MKTTLLLLLLVFVDLPNCLSQRIDLWTLPGTNAEANLGCPTTGDCYDKYGGFCYNALSDPQPVCERVVEGMCSVNDQNTCKCCIRCTGRACLKEPLSACREKCQENEFTMSQCNQHCQCCQPCKPTQCKGRCVSHPDLCGEAKEFIEGICEGGKCACCVTCKPDLGCEKSGGQCVNSEEECPCGFWPSPYFGCNNGSKNCKCCTPCPPSHTCSGGHELGRCVPNEPYCNGHDEYISDEACCQGGCSCCKTCNPDRTCLAENGNCFKKEIGCGPGLMESTRGNCTNDNCVCCVPEPCPNSCNCTEGHNPGRCVAQPVIIRYNEYPSEERCIGRKCSCYKTCTPDPLCSAIDGTCFTAKTGCGRGLVPSNMGHCNSKNCICCVEQPCWPSLKCTLGDDPGRCETEKEQCTSPSEYISETTPCKGEGCFCCKTCGLDLSCEKVRGTCIVASKGCGRGFKMSESGRCKNTENCVCCEPEFTKG